MGKFMCPSVLFNSRTTIWLCMKFIWGWRGTNRPIVMCMQFWFSSGRINVSLCDESKNELYRF